MSAFWIGFAVGAAAVVAIAFAVAVFVVICEQREW